MSNQIVIYKPTPSFVLFGYALITIGFVALSVTEVDIILKYILTFTLGLVTCLVFIQTLFLLIGRDLDDVISEVPD